jgi:rod shape-determining protein MreC
MPTRRFGIKFIFKSRRYSLLELIFFMVLSLTIMLFDQHSRDFHYWRTQASVVVYPIRAVVDAPIRFFHWLGSSFSLQQRLLNQNAKLHAQQLLLRAKLQTLLELKSENQALHQLLSSSAKLQTKVKVARILAVGMRSSLHQVVLNQGRNAHAYVGQPILDGYGVMGQIVAVGPLTSKVLLITDSRFAIPAQDTRNGLREIVVGTGAVDQLHVINVVRTAELKKGDLLVSSGFGLRFPVGYPIGVISKIQRAPGTRFMVVEVAPAARLDQTQQVLMAWPSQSKLRQAVRQQLAKTLVASRGIK